MRILCVVALACSPSLAYGDPRQVCIEATIRDDGKTLSSPTLIALEGEPASFQVGSPDMTLKLAFTARLQSGAVALDIAYNEKSRPDAKGAWTTRSFTSRAVVKDRDSITIELPSREIVITPRTRTAAGSDRCSRAGA